MDPHDKFRKLRFLRLPEHDSNILIDKAKAESFPEWAREAELPPRFRFTNTGEMEATRYYRISFEKFWDWKDYCLGYVAFVPNPIIELDDPLEQFTRKIPMQEPTMPWMYATTCTLTEGGGKGTRARYRTTKQEKDLLDAGFVDDPDDRTILGYDATEITQDSPDWKSVVSGQATVEVGFRPRKWIVRNDDQAREAAEKFNKDGAVCVKEMTRWVTWEVTYSIQAMPLHKITVAAAADQNADLQKPLRFVEAPYFEAQIPEAGMVLLPTASILVVWHEVPSLNWEKIFGAVGRVNDQAFGGLYGYPVFDRETLLCQAPAVREIGRSVRGHRLFDITYRFDYRPQGWNHTLTPTGTFLRYGFKKSGVAFDRDNDSVYKKYDFLKLFAAPSPPRKFE